MAEWREFTVHGGETYFGIPEHKSDESILKYGFPSNNHLFRTFLCSKTISPGFMGCSVIRSTLRPQRGQILGKYPNISTHLRSICRLVIRSNEVQ